MLNKQQPNILFIMSDDHAAHAMSCYGSKVNQTPNLDRIAKEGARFNNCFCTNSICEPSRAAILCGTYNHINKVTTIGAHIDNRLPNVAKELQFAGYQTAIIGKWHLGETEPHYPTGFDEWKILIDQGTYFDPDIICNGKLEKLTGYTTDIITDLTIDFIENRDKNRPFFLKCHHKAPHRNWLVDDKHKEMYNDIDLAQPETLFDDYSNRSQAAKDAEMRVKDHMSYSDLKLIPPANIDMNSFVPHPEDLTNFYLVPQETEEKVYFKNHKELVNFKYQRYIKDYLRCIASIDDNVGRLLDYLERENILDNTVIIYTSDQGFFLGDHGWYDKRFMYEESLKMPFIVRYPKEIKAGTVVDEFMTNVDIPASFVDWAGIEKPEYFQGYSIRPLFTDCVPKDWQKSIYYRYWMHLTHHYISAHYGIRTKDYKLIYYYGEALNQPCTINEPKKPEWELFDLTKDPKELNNVYHRAEYKDIVKNLKNELHQLQAKVKDSPVDEIE